MSTCFCWDYPNVTEKPSIIHQVTAKQVDTRATIQIRKINVKLRFFEVNNSLNNFISFSEKYKIQKNINIKNMIK